MKITRIQMRAAPKNAAVPLPARAAGVAHTPTAVATLVRPAATRPRSVSALSWELLAMHVEDAQRRSSIAFAALRSVVQCVVREMRVAEEPWDVIYVVLQSAVVPASGRPERFATEYEMHTSRSAALVAHMHSWADVERLAELEAGSQGD